MQVKEVSENPLAKVHKHRSAAGGSEMKAGEKAMETQVLESSIHKICSLLSVSGVGACLGCWPLARGGVVVPAYSSR